MSLVLVGLVAPTASALAADLSVTPVTWDIVGLRSNGPTNIANPHEYPVGVKICNLTASPLNNGLATFAWTGGSTRITLQNDDPISLGTLAAAGDVDGADCGYAFWTAEVERVSAAFDNARSYTITASADGAASATSPANRQLYVEHLVWQNRNSTKKIAGPGGCNSSFTSCDPAPQDLAVGESYTYKLYGQTATTYEELQSFITLPGTIFRVDRVTSEFETPAGASAGGPWGDGCGWDSDSTSGSYRTCVGPVGYTGGKVGGRVVVTYDVTVLDAGSGTLNALFYDFSGSSYHYNSDYGSVTYSVDVTARYPLTATVTGDGTLTSAPSGINCGGGETDCEALYAGGTVTLTATPSPGQNFISWGGACSSATPVPPDPGPYTCTVTMDQARDVTANFDGTTQWPLTVDVQGAGSVSVVDPNDSTLVDCTGDGGTSCADAFADATVVQLSATPDTGWVFVGWSGVTCEPEQTDVSFTCWVTMTQARNAIAIFEPAATTLYPLDVTITGAAGGTVTTDPAGITDCEDACAASYEDGTTVTMTATPADGYYFTGWSGVTCATPEAVSPADPTCTVTMDQAHSAVATFARLYPLDVTIVGSGTVTGSAPSVIDCADAPAPASFGPLAGDVCTDDFADGDTVVLTATPAPGYVFTGWSGVTCVALGAIDAADPTCAVTMTQAQAVTATFVLARLLTVVVTGPGSVSADTGTLVNCVAGLNTGSIQALVVGSCDDQYADGTLVTLTATPESGKVFKGWGGACSGTALTCTVTMDQARNVTALFADATPPATTQHQLDTTITGGGSVVSSPAGIDCTTSCNKKFDENTKVTLTATPQPGYRFSGWGGACSGTAPTCTVTMDKAQSVTATFIKTAPDLRLTVTSSRARIRNGQTVTVRLRAQNVGDATAEGVTTCLVIPKGFQVVSTGGGTLKGNKVCFKVSSLDPDKTEGYAVKLRAVSAKKQIRFAGTTKATNAPKIAAGKASPVPVRPAKPTPPKPTG